MFADRHPTAAGGLRIRDATADDRGDIHDILLDSYGPYRAHIAPEVFTRYVADLHDLTRHVGRGRLLVAELDDGVAGYVSFYREAAAQGMGWPVGWAGGRGLGVRPAARGQGIAVALLGACVEQGRAQGSPVFAFHTSAFMSTAVALYERLGYRRAPGFDLDMNAHYGHHGGPAWTALAYLRVLGARHHEPLAA
jgi:GNAT superfamily N-acetyltransferase